MTGVLHVITGLGAGGAENMLSQLACGLQSKGLPQHVVGLLERGPVADQLNAGNVPVSALDAASVYSAPRGLFRLVKLIREMQPVVIQGWMYHGNLAATLAHRLCPGRSARALFWNLRASNMDGARYAGVIGWNARLSRLPELIIANSQVGLGYHLGSGFHPRRQMVIPNGIDTKKFHPDLKRRSSMRRELGFTSKDIVAVNVSRVDPMKDHECFLAAMRALPGVKGLLVGLGTEELALSGNVKAVGIRHDVPDLHAACDIVVSSSAFGEGFSNALAEGMSSGLVPVATDVGDSAIIVGKTGTVVQPRDSAALADAIDAVSKNSAEALRTRGMRARERIVREFALERAIERYAAIYDEAVA